MKLSDRETASVLAALRFWQNNVDDPERSEELNGYGHFTDHTPLTHEEVDALCEELNCDDEDTAEAANPDAQALLAKLLCTHTHERLTLAFDDAVHITCSHQATNINNQGQLAQLNYLFSQMNGQEVLELLRKEELEV